MQARKLEETCSDNHYENENGQLWVTDDIQIYVHGPVQKSLLGLTLGEDWLTSSRWFIFFKKQVNNRSNNFIIRYSCTLWTKDEKVDKHRLAKIYSNSSANNQFLHKKLQEWDRLKAQIALWVQKTSFISESRCWANFLKPKEGDSGLVTLKFKQLKLESVAQQISVSKGKYLRWTSSSTHR